MRTSKEFNDQVEQATIERVRAWLRDVRNRRESDENCEVGTLVLTAFKDLGHETPYFMESHELADDANPAERLMGIRVEETLGAEHL